MYGSLHVPFDNKYPFFYLQRAPLLIVMLHAWKDHRTRYTLCTFPSYFVLMPMAVCVLFVFLDL